jgi:type II pantothenate kinase
LDEQGHQIEHYIFANVGTGTSFHYFDGKDQQRVGGVGTGGGMIQGLGYLLSNITDYKELTNLCFTFKSMASRSPFWAKLVNSL